MAYPVRILRFSKGGAVRNRQFLAPILVIAGLAVAFATMVASQGYATLRDGAVDAILAVRRPVQSVMPIVVVDIDRATLAEVGPWPWSRERLAQLVSAIIDARPRVLGLDILIDGPDERSPAALARKLGQSTGRAEFAALAATLADGDVALAAALARGKTVLGLALDPDGSGNAPAAAPILIGGQPDLTGLWQAPGAIGPVATIAAATTGFGILALSGDGDGHIRQVPLLVTTGGVLRPGLALDIVRLATEAGAYVVDGGNRMLRIGDRGFALTTDGMLRLRPTSEAAHAVRTVPAGQVLRSAETRARLTGAIVLLGSSAPELGGLRPSASGALVPTVQIQADAVAQMLAGDHPHRPAWLGRFELVALVLLSLATGWLALRQPPLKAAMVTIGLAIGWLALTVAALDVRQWLVDPLTPPLGAASAFAVAALAAASRTRIREAAIRRRFEQQLPAAVVRRLLEAPELLKLEGEARRVTALFTDIEGFTAMTERAGPRALVAMLDRYFDGLVRIVIEHGGMVEKIVGDGLHAIFNAPLDLDDHAGKAVACALAIASFSDRFRAEGDALRLGFGPTRIGIETGDVILGDVGGGRFLDYTAHGDVMNTAARLEVANKELGSRICIGPVAAAAIGPALIRPLGRIAVRGRSQPLAVFEPWPSAMTDADRAAFRQAADLLASDRSAAAASFALLAARYPHDASLARLAAEITRRSAEPP
jgi:adenylate cyclase